MSDDTETPEIDITEAAEAALRALAAVGDLTPARVVEAASDEASPLHSCFEWDDAAAAAAHRLDQARRLIRSVRIEITVHEHVFRVPAYVHDPRRDKDGGYTETTKLASDRDLALRVLRQEVARAIGCLDRARRVAAAVGMSATLDALLAKAQEAEIEIEKEAEAA